MGKTWENYFDGYHCNPEWTVFDVRKGRHMRDDLAGERSEIVGRAARLLDEWHADAMCTATHPQDPMQTVLEAGGASHVRGFLPAYLRRLREAVRDRWAERIKGKHPQDAALMICRPPCAASWTKGMPCLISRRSRP